MAKIKYDFNKKKFRTFNEIQGSCLVHKNLLKQPNRKVHKYTTYVLFQLIFIFVIVIVSMNVFPNDEKTISIITQITTVFLLGIFLQFYVCLYCFFSRGKNSFDGIVVIDKKGIEDHANYGIVTSTTWAHVKCVIRTKNSIVIVTTTPIVFMYENNDKILQAISKYNKDIPIFDKI